MLIGLEFKTILIQQEKTLLFGTIGKQLEFVNKEITKF